MAGHGSAKSLGRAVLQPAFRAIPVVSCIGICSNGVMMNQTPLETALNRAMIRWSLTKSALVAETQNGWVFKVEQNGRDMAALKIIKPHVRDQEGRGTSLLEYYSGEGAVTVFDVHEDAIFMEWLDGGTLGILSRSGRDAEATEAFASTVQKLHMPRADFPKGLAPLRQNFDALFETDVRQWPHTARDLYARCAGTALKLFDKPTREVPLHGDLHHDNIMRSDRGWLAIDPKGLYGDPHYEVANAFRNPHNAIKVAANAKRISDMADVFSAKLQLNRKRILGFAAVHSGLAACWNLQAGNAIHGDLAVLPLLLSAYDQA